MFYLFTANLSVLVLLMLVYVNDTVLLSVCLLPCLV